MHNNVGGRWLDVGLGVGTNVKETCGMYMYNNVYRRERDGCGCRVGNQCQRDM